MAALQPRFLADNSALSRMRHESVSAALIPLITGGVIARCGIFELELLFSARSYRDFTVTRERLELGYPVVPTEEVDFERAIDVMGLLARSGKHRSASIPDLLLAAVAERHRLEVIHYDADFDHIASVTGQPVRWVVPQGSLP